MSRKPKKGYFVRGEFVAEGSELDLQLKAEMKHFQENSRTELKRESTELQKLGESLLTLRPALRDALNLSEKLRDALDEANRITNFEGRRRQMQYVGKLMRLLDDEEVAAVRAALDEQHGGSAAREPGAARGRALARRPDRARRGPAGVAGPAPRHRQPATARPHPPGAQGPASPARTRSRAARCRGTAAPTARSSSSCGSNCSMPDAFDPVRIGIVSISDRASTGVYEDKGLPALKDWLTRALKNPITFEPRLIPDEKDRISAALVELVDAGCSLVLTTGGTGPARRDVTPEATLAIADKEMPGFGEQMRQISLKFVPTAILSRQVAVIRGESLVINLPGQPKSIQETLEGLKDADGQQVVPGIFAAVPYCIDLIGGSLPRDPRRRLQGIPSQVGVQLQVHDGETRISTVTQFRRAGGLLASQHVSHGHRGFDTRYEWQDGQLRRAVTSNWAEGQKTWLCQDVYRYDEAARLNTITLEYLGDDGTPSGQTRLSYRRPRKGETLATVAAKVQALLVDEIARALPQIPAEEPIYCLLICYTQEDFNAAWPPFLVWGLASYRDKVLEAGEEVGYHLWAPDEIRAVQGDAHERWFDDAALKEACLLHGQFMDVAQSTASARRVLKNLAAHFNAPAAHAMLNATDDFVVAHADNTGEIDPLKAMKTAIAPAHWALLKARGRV
jgi:molybdenum cofactor synthesis domain-containing protein